MAILTKEVEVRLNGNNIKHYKNLGYEIPMREASKILKIKGVDYVADLGKIINVKVNDLPLKSNILIEAMCDYCGEVNHSIKYVTYNSQTKNNTQKYACKKCSQFKVEQTNLEKYGVKCVLYLDEIKEKIKQTNLDRYGVENALLNKDIKDKRDATLMEKFGTLYPLQNNECFKKFKQTNMEKYGAEFTLQSEEIKQKIKQTNLDKYGYENSMQSPEISEKWFSKYGSEFVNSSKQQRYLCDLYNGILNYPFKCFALDVCIPNDKLDVEFDGSGHKMSISLGSISEEDFEMKELYRNVAIKKEGYKQMRIISTKDLLPSDDILLQMLSIARNYFNTTSHTWINFDIDNSIMINAENKDTNGVFFDYGELRRIKKLRKI